MVTVKRERNWWRKKKNGGRERKKNTKIQKRNVETKDITQKNRKHQIIERKRCVPRVQRKTNETEQQQLLYLQNYLPLEYYLPLFALSFIHDEQIKFEIDNKYLNDR